MLEIDLPWPPSVNRYWRNVNGTVKISRAGRQYIKTVSMLVSMHHKTIESRVAVKILATPPDRRRRDLDNINKALLDGLTKAGVWLDDSQIDDLHIIRLSPLKPGDVKVIITEIEAKQ